MFIITYKHHILAGVTDSVGSSCLGQVIVTTGDWAIEHSFKILYSLATAMSIKLYKSTIKNFKMAHP